MSQVDTLERWLTFMEQNNIDDDRIYANLAKIDSVRLKKWLSRLDRVEQLKCGPSKKRKEFEGQRSRVKGALYEKIVDTVVRGVSCFQSWTNVQSSTNELDILVVLGPRAVFIPALRKWGSHCICECKYHTSYVKTDWVTKLNTVLQTHNANVGVLFSRKGLSRGGPSARVRHQLQLLAVSAQARFIVCFSREDLVECTNGTNFLRLLVSRFVEMQIGAEKLALLAG